VHMNQCLCDKSREGMSCQLKKGSNTVRVIQKQTHVKYVLDSRYGVFELRIRSEHYANVKRALFSPGSFRDFNLTLLSVAQQNSSLVIRLFASAGGRRIDEGEKARERILSALVERTEASNHTKLGWIESQPLVVQLSDIALQFSFYCGALFTLSTILCLLQQTYYHKNKSDVSQPALHMSFICLTLSWIRFVVEMGPPNSARCITQAVLAASVSTVAQRFSYYVLTIVTIELTFVVALSLCKVGSALNSEPTPQHARVRVRQRRCLLYGVCCC
jgi:hypothetical protein